MVRATEKPTVDHKGHAQTWLDNMLKAADLTRSILEQWTGKQALNTHIAHSLKPFIDSMGHLLTAMADNPALMQQWWSEWLQQQSAVLLYTSHRLMGLTPTAPLTVAKKDYRFDHPLWTSNPVFEYYKYTFYAMEQALDRAVHALPGLATKDRNRAQFVMKTWCSALSPSNYPWTNPAVLKKTIESHGTNLTNGLRRLMDDLRRSHYGVSITRTASAQFQPGATIASTPGKVVYENHLMQLIYYTPTTPETCAEPLLIIPPWINKYYILDLQAHNSMVRWLRDRGYAVFMISWVNPDVSYADTHFADYLIHGALQAMQTIRQMTHAPQLHVTGYCIGGTLLSCLLAYLAHHGLDWVASASLITTLTDFSDAGDLQLFADEAQMEWIESVLEKDGYFDGELLSQSFSAIRANEMIWSFVVRHYLLDEEPLAFDLLHWNTDTARLPAAMHRYYVRHMYMDNALIQSNHLTMADTPIDLSRIQVPLLLIGCMEDHITPWKGAYATHRYVSGPVDFLLSGSGHVAGVINPPNAEKYYYLEGPSPRGLSSDEWMQRATRHPGSWWLAWDRWIARHSQGKSADTIRAMHDVPALEPAPGRYVLVR